MQLGANYKNAQKGVKRRNMWKSQKGAIGKVAQNIAKNMKIHIYIAILSWKCMKLHILNNKMHKNVMFMKL